MTILYCTVQVGCITAWTDLHNNCDQAQLDLLHDTMNAPKNAKANMTLAQAQYFLLQTHGFSCDATYERPPAPTPAPTPSPPTRTPTLTPTPHPTR